MKSAPVVRLFLSLLLARWGAAPLGAEVEVERGREIGRRKKSLSLLGAFVITHRCIEFIAPREIISPIILRLQRRHRRGDYVVGRQRSHLQLAHHRFVLFQLLGRRRPGLQ